MTKRWRAPKAKPGELVARWGKVDGMVDVCYNWGDGIGKCDASLLNTVIACKRFRPSLNNPGGYEADPSFLDELTARGYDLTTLRFSIQKKTA